jgi:hypothetical protein
MGIRSVPVAMLLAALSMLASAQQPGSPVQPPKVQAAPSDRGIVSRPVEAAPEKEQAVQTPAPPGRTPDPSVRTPKLPSQYEPMALPPKFNSNDPPMITDSSELSRIKVQAPQWVQQFLAFPPPTELLHSLGVPLTQDIRDKALEAIRQVVAPRFLVDEMRTRMIPLSGWAVLYEDWRKHGGTDVFLIKYQKDAYTIEIAETHNHIIALVRYLENKRSDDYGGILKLVFDYSEILFVEHMKPVDRESMKLFKTNASPAFIYGYYTPKVVALTAGESGPSPAEGRVPDETSGSAGAAAVRFFSNGDFAAFMLLKPAYGAELKNPFEPRFELARAGKTEEVPFWEQQAAEKAPQLSVGEEIKRRQIEEWFGNYVYDAEGHKLTLDVPMQELENAFLELSREQKQAITKRKMIDEYYTSGTKAFQGKDYDSALRYWSRILSRDLDPENPRVAILLQMAIREKLRLQYGGRMDGPAKQDPNIAAALDAVSRQQTVLALKKEQEDQQEIKERAITNYRTRATNFLSEGNIAESLKEWNNLLEIDPGNPAALLFKDLCEQRLREKKRGK